MKKASIFLWFLLPLLICVLLLPPISYTVFRSRAEKQAYALAEQDLHALQDEVARLAQEMLPESVDPKGSRIQPFLRSVSSAISRAGGSARLLLYADESRLIYPAAEDAADVLALSSLVAESLGQNGNGSTFSVRVDEEAYLVHISPSPVRTKRLTYLVAYCPIASIGPWVADAGRTVLLLSLALSLIFALLAFALVRRLTRSLQTVEAAAEQIRSKNFITVSKPFPTRELDSLRVSVNAMSEQLKNADQREKAFFQNVSHELRTPLMSISGYAQGIEQEVFSDDKEAARIILSESQRLTEMVNTLLALSRLDRKDEPPIVTEHTAAELISEAADRIAGVCLQRGIALERRDGSGGMRLRTDEKRVALILDNLLSNAVRYAKTTVRIGAALQGDRLTFTVEDDGDGIEEKDLPYIFDRCYTGKGGHNGLGLALAKAAATSLSAELTVKNGPEGAVFQLILDV